MGCPVIEIGIGKELTAAGAVLTNVDVDVEEGVTMANLDGGN